MTTDKGNKKRARNKSNEKSSPANKMYILGPFLSDAAVGKKTAGIERKH